MTALAWARLPEPSARDRTRHSFLIDERPVWETWTSRLPTWPLCCDGFSDGVFRRSRLEALKRQHLEFNTPAFLNWLVFDVDQEDSFESWERANLHAPNLYVQNRSNGRAHLGYALATPVGTCVSHRRAPIELAAAVQRGMTRRLAADPAYANRLAKNPLHPEWRASWLNGQPFDLTALLEPLGREDTRPHARRSEIAGISRNCDLFDELRHFAYRKVLAYKETRSLDAWRRCLFDEVRLINLGFAMPLTISELRQIAQSVAKWSWREFSREKFSEIQAERARHGRSLAAKATAASITAAKRELASTNDPSRRRRDDTAETIARRVGKSPRTVRRHVAEPRAEYEAGSIQCVKPWLVHGISRSTWYRRRKAACGCKAMAIFRFEVRFAEPALRRAA